MESVKEITQERPPLRIEEVIGDILVPPIVEETVEVVHSLPQERLQQRTMDQALVLPTAEETVESVQIIQERIQQSIEEPIVDAPVPQTMEEQLVAVAPTPAREGRWKRHLAAQVPLIEHVTPAPDAVHVASALAVEYLAPGIEGGSCSSSVAHAAATRTGDIVE